MTVGIQDPWVAIAYLLSIGGAFLCVVYGFTHWNQGDEPVKPEDVKWAKEETDDIEATL